MGLFDFFKDAGDDINSKVEVSPERVDALRAENINSSVAKLDVDGEQVNVAVKGDTVTLTGTAPSQEALEKIVLCAGNQFGIASVDCQLKVVAQEPVAAAAPSPGAPTDATTAAAAPAAASTFYTVKSGDSLSKIAKDFYGDANKYMMIFEANKPMLSDPDKIYPGQNLRIPPK